MAARHDVRQNPDMNTEASGSQEKNANSAVVTVRSGDSDSESMKEHHEWKPGWFHQFPWTGIGALIGVLFCSAAAVAVIYASNGKAKSEWKIRAAPNVLVSIFNSLSGILVTMAVGQGIAISWWRRAMKGTTVEDLHNSWSFSSSMMSLVKNYKAWNVIALAALCTKFAIIDSTLFQKALSTRTALGPPSNHTTGVFPTDTFPVTGQLNQFGNATSTMTFPMTFDLNYWLESWNSINSYSLNGFYDCLGLCSLTYRGIGLASTCSYTNTSVSRSQSAVSGGGDNTLMDMSFTQKWPSQEKNYSYIELSWASWSSDSDLGIANPDCTGQLYNLTCELRPAIIDYPITMQNSSYSVRKSKDKNNNYVVYIGDLNITGGYYEGTYWMEDATKEHQLPDFNVIQYLDVPESQTPSGNTSIGGIAMALQTYYNTHSTVSYQSETTTDSATHQNSTSSKPIVSSTGLQTAFAQYQDYHDGCPVGYSNPLDNEEPLTISSVLANINILTLLVSEDIQLRSNFTGDINAYDDFYNTYWDDTAVFVNTQELKDETYYVSRMGFAWGAFASTIIVVLLILPSYWGYWQLGRKVTLGPLEIANAFDAPAFSHVSTGAGHVDGVLKAVGKERVQYGAKEHEAGVKYGFTGARAV